MHVYIFERKEEWGGAEVEGGADSLPIEEPDPGLHTGLDPRALRS